MILPVFEGLLTDARRTGRVRRAVYLSAEQFTSYFLEALRGSVTATIGALVDIGVTAELCSSGGPGSSTITMASRVRKKLDDS